MMTAGKAGSFDSACRHNVSWFTADVYSSIVSLPLVIRSLLLAMVFVRQVHPSIDSLSPSLLAAVLSLLPSFVSVVVLRLSAALLAAPALSSTPGHHRPASRAT
eukprot:GHVU01171399.1.p3 GENE.GHVU01171399.1~~GHVU01171399.1.p3  ORF type:complete len:104 (-),score=8.49 GHVU01171399.1:389-700(-)